MSFLALIKAQFQQKGRYKENERFLSDLIQDVLKAIGILSNLVYALGSGSLLTGSQIGSVARNIEGYKTSRLYL